MIRTAVAGIAVIVATSCGDVSEGATGSTQVVDSAGVPIATTRVTGGSPTCSVSDEALRIGSVDGSESTALFGVNGAAVLRDGRIAVVNRGTSQIKVFSPDGELVHEFGREGKGPAEFKNLWSVHLRAPDTLVVGDYRPWRFTFFTPEGDLIRRVELKPAVIERPDFAMPLGPGAGFVMEEPVFRTQDEMVDRVVPLRLYGEDGEDVGVVGDFWLDRFGYLSRDIRYVGNPIFGAEASFDVSPDGRVLYATGRHEQVEFWQPSGELLSIIRWESRGRVVEPGDADAWRRQRLEAIESRFEITPAMKPVIEAQVGDHLPVADVYPGHDHVVISDRGDIWVQEYRRPLDEGPANWFVFASDGRFRCRAELLPELYVLAGQWRPGPGPLERQHGCRIHTGLRY